jgi:hypothetical protein
MEKIEYVIEKQNPVMKKELNMDEPVSTKV